MARQRMLHIAPNLDLPIELVTGTQAIMATIGQGKSHLAQVEAEEMLEYRQQILVIDPTDAWSGLRSSADGKRDGYPITIFGGKHGDMKLDPDAGAVIAEAMVREGFSCILCTVDLSDDDEVRLIRTVLETLFRINKGPMHLFLDECDLYCNQLPHSPEDFRAMRAVSRIVRRGRIKGLGVTVITQRPSDINKRVLSQCALLMVLGMEHNTDIEPIAKWIKNKRNPELVTELLESLTTLQLGEAWAWSPRKKLHLRFRARAKRTFDSGATPKVGQKRRVAKRLAPVDLQRLGAAIAATVQRQKENDPIALKAEVARLKRDLLMKSTTSAPLASSAMPKQPVQYLLKEGQLKRVEKLIDRGGKVAQQLATFADKTTPASAAISEALVQLRMTLGTFAQAGTPSKHAGKLPPVEVKMPPNGTYKVLGPPSELGRGAASAQKVKKPAGDQGPPHPLSKMDRAFLTMLVQQQEQGLHPHGLTRKQLLIFTGYANSGTVGASFSRLLSEGLATNTNGLMAITLLGRHELGPVQPMPVGDALREQLIAGTSGGLSKMERSFLQRAAEVYPKAIDRTTARGEYANSGTVGAAFSQLIGKGYFVKVHGGVKVADELFGS